MRVRHGWSGEISTNRWAKDDVELEEEDLRRLLRDAGLPGDTPVSSALAFQLLEVEAERLLTAKLMRRYDYPGRQHLTDLAAQKTALLAQLPHPSPTTSSLTPPP